MLIFNCIIAHLTHEYENYSSRQVHLVSCYIFHRYTIFLIRMSSCLFHGFDIFVGQTCCLYCLPRSWSSQLAREVNPTYLYRCSLLGLLTYYSLWILYNKIIKTHLQLYSYGLLSKWKICT